MLLDHERQRPGAARGDLAARLGRRLEVALLPVALQQVGHGKHRVDDMPASSNPGSHVAGALAAL
jgi:hypothetical protein